MLSFAHLRQRLPLVRSNAKPKRKTESDDV
jgi:hypothetical protein